jgi:Methyltransferase domain
MDKTMTSLRDLGRRVSNAATVMRTPLYAPPGHFYSPVSSPHDVETARSTRRTPPGIVLEEQAQLTMLDEVLSHAMPPGGRYQPDNEWYPSADAAVYWGMLSELQPSRVIEVGSGFSSAVALDWADATGSDVQLTFVEPNTERLRSLLRRQDYERVTLVEHQVQALEPRDLTDLAPNDILFIDSSHVVKSGSDVVYLYLQVLPLLPTGVRVHIHDIFWPFELPDEWLEQRRDWFEPYLLQALLADSSRWRVALWSNWLWTNHRDRFGGVEDASMEWSGPGSIWLERL